MRFNRARTQGLCPMSLNELPYTKGFEFIGVKHDGTRIECEIRTVGDSFRRCFYVTDKNGVSVFDQLKGWVRK